MAQARPSTATVNSGPSHNHPSQVTAAVEAQHGSTVRLGLMPGLPSHRSPNEAWGSRGGSGADYSHSLLHQNTYE